MGHSSPRQVSSGIDRVQIRFTPPPLIHSPLGRLDARWRLAALLVAILAAAVVRALATSGLALAGALLLAALAHMPWRWYIARLTAAGALILLFVVPLPLLVPRLEGVQLAGVILLKSLALFSLACVLLVTAPLETTFKAAHALYIPGLLVHLTLLSYRYLFVLGEELARLRIALRVRGFRNRANRHAWKTAGAATGTLLVRGHDRAERVAHAMRCRGFDGRFRALTPFHTRVADVLALLLVLLAAAGLVALDILLASR
jgi:cobalt/nickel transport system permease protein